MQYVPFDREEALSSLQRATEGRSIFAAQYNAIVVLLGSLRDSLVSSLSPRVSVQDTLGSGRMGLLVGWSDPSTLTGDREVASAALGYALRRLRTGHRFLRHEAVEVVPVGDSWGERVAVTAEPETALVSPTAVLPDTLVELDPSSARDALDAYTYGSNVLLGQAPSTELASRVAWMAREYATTSSRAEWIAYAALAGGTLLSLVLLGAFRRSSAPAQTQQSPQLGGVPMNPYGGAIARPGSIA